MKKDRFQIIDKKYLECNPEIAFINTEQDILDLIGASFQYRKIIIYQTNLDPKFFDLSSGLAGIVLQKLAQYQIQTAFIINLESIQSERFKELIYETNSNDEYRFFGSKNEASQWLD